MGRVLIKQHDISDCGVACLASVAAYYKLNIPLARIRQFASTDKKGTNVLGLLQAAGKLGFDAKGVRADMNSMPNLPKPAIAHLVVEQSMSHFVVLYKFKKNKVVLMDPALGRLCKVPLEQFEKEWTGVLVILIPNEQFEKRNERVSVLQRFWFLLNPHRAILFQAFIGSLVYTLLGFSTAIYIQKLTDFVFTGGNSNLLNLLSLVMLLILVFQTAIAVFRDIFLIRTGQLIDVRLILGYYKHLMKLPQQFFDTMQVGEILSRVNDALKIRNFINSVILNITVNFLIILFSFGLMFALYWQLALIMLIILPVYLSIYILINYLNKKSERKVMEAAGRLESQLVESLNTVKTIKLFGLEVYAGNKTESHFIDLLNKGYTSSLNNLFSVQSTYFVSAMFAIILLWAGSYLVIQREISPGELLSFYAILGYFTGPVSRLINSNKEIQNALIAADRLFEIMDLESEERTGLSLKQVHYRGDILFKDVCFRYGSQEQLFSYLNLKIPGGKITAIIGESGSGKSSLVNIIQKLYPIQQGLVSVCGTELAYHDTASLREHIAVVPQEIHLFSGNVTDNIAVGDPDPSMEAILQLCETLGLLDFIEALPQGFDTQLGENGALLSGGQKQRLAIARALYKDPEVLILDEATSSLDSRAEYFIQKAVEQFRNRHKTVIMIAHRLSTVSRADKIIVLAGGRVAEEGCHKELFLKKGHYYQLWQKQLPPSGIAV